ncbi:MAG TPA: hypothetical protein VI011_24085 [Asanoa sp.]
MSGVGTPSAFNGIRPDRGYGLANVIRGDRLGGGGVGRLTGDSPFAGETVSSGAGDIRTRIVERHVRFDR